MISSRSEMAHRNHLKCQFRASRGPREECCNKFAIFMLNWTRESRPGCFRNKQSSLEQRPSGEVCLFLQQVKKMRVRNLS